MSTDVIYSRVPSGLKDAVGGYAAARQTSLAAAVVELLKLGIDADRNGPAIEILDSRMGEIQERLERETARRELAEQRLELLERTAESWTRRAAQRVGECPSCHDGFSGHDLFVSGECPHCHATISALLMPDKQQRGLDEKQLLVLVGAVGLLLGVLAAVRK